MKTLCSDACCFCEWLFVIFTMADCLQRGSVRGKLPCYAGMTEVLAQKEGTKIDQRNAQKLYLTSNGFGKF